MLMGAVLVSWLALASLAVPEERACRTRRRIVFSKGGKMFVRLNIKENLLPSTILFAFAYGFKMSYDLPTDVRHSPLHRRDLYRDVEALLGQHGLDGRACVLRSLCEAAQLTPSGGLFQKALALMFTVPDSERGGLHPYHVADDCSSVSVACPLSLLHAVPLEDTVE